jgi:hypothetical protein
MRTLIIAKECGALGSGRTACNTSPRYWPARKTITDLYEAVRVKTSGDSGSRSEKMRWGGYYEPTAPDF